jgi:hypothetical protein
MIVALVLGILAVIVLLSLSASETVPWGGRLKRLHAGVARKAEWMAPDDVVSRVVQDYLDILDWLSSSALNPLPSSAEMYLTGQALHRYLELTKPGKVQRFAGVLTAQHDVQVRHFSEDGSECLVIDCQTQRRMLTYNLREWRLLHGQDLEDGTVVYRMVYDSVARRWKISSFIQELPTGWQAQQSTVRLLATLPITVGRDN